MRTPKEFNQNLKKNIITGEMLAQCLFSVNKRAKNHRNKQSIYRNMRCNNRYWTDEYGYEDRYREKKEEYYQKKDKLLSILTPTCIHREKGIWDDRYYLFYKIGDYSFHHPIDMDEVEEYSLEVVEIDNLVTRGKDVTDLISCQFVDRVLAVIDTGKYILQMV